MKSKRIFISFLLTGIALLSSCGGGSTPTTDGRLQVLATTSIVADVVRQVGGDYVAVSTLIPIGTDPHEYSPRPRDATAIATAKIIFANGAGLEEFLNPLMESAGGNEKMIEVSGGIRFLTQSESESGGGPTLDPHTWMDPNNVLIWVDNITTALSSADPDHAVDYQVNAESYSISLIDLDSWIRSEVELIAPDHRIIVSDHGVLGYFIHEYGFSQLGTITGSFSTDAAPSAREVARLEDKIRNSGVRAIFITEPSNQTLADQIAQDTGIQAVWIYHASLTDSRGPASSYLDFMRYNVSAIVEALR
jgi:manganese/iron transport system substrate-binding protein